MSWTPTSALAQAVSKAGFLYDPGQDIIYSRKDAWQRRVGFAWAYDVAAAGMHMIIDCEPFYFQYAGKLWLIELWKGQYGLETGAEIGVYRDEAGVGLLSYQPHSRFYSSVGPGDELEMRFTLYRQGNEFLRRADKHWWLTGWRWGVFTASPLDLRMEIEIFFPQQEMCDAFKKALQDKRYPVTERGASGVFFTFDYPREPQPGARRDLQGQVQSDNEQLVSRYNDLKRKMGAQNNDPNQFKQLDSLLSVGAALSPAAKKVQDYGAPALRNVQSAASAAARKVGAMPMVASKLGEATIEAVVAYRELCTYFDKNVWRGSK